MTEPPMTEPRPASVLIDRMLASIADEFPALVDRIDLIRRGIAIEAETVAALLADNDRLRAAARDYLLNDGSGIGRTDEWRGPYDAARMMEARDRLRAALEGASDE